MDITKFANMAKLALTEEEAQILGAKAEELLDGFSALDSVDVGETPPMVTVLDRTNVLREDVAVKFMPREELLRNAPDARDGCFVVPRMV